MYYAMSIITGRWILVNGKRAVLSQKMKDATEKFMAEQNIRHIVFVDREEIDRDERKIFTYYGGTNPND